MEVRLVLQTGKQAGRETALARGVYLVGRSQVCQIRPKNKSVSRKHCAIIHRRREILLQDIGSKTGTYLNGKKLEPGIAVAIESGDNFRVGRTKFRFEITTAANEPCDSAIQDGEATRLKEPNADTKGGENSYGQPKPAVTALVADAANSTAFTTNIAAASFELNSNSPLLENSSAKPGSAIKTSPIDEVLELLEQDEEDNAENSQIVHEPNRVTVGEIELDEDDSDGDVDFAAPQSEESLSSELPVPSYQLRQDWDVTSVHKWVANKQVDAPKANLPKPSFKLKDPKKRREPLSEEEQKAAKIRAIQEELAPKEPSALERLSNSDLKPYFAIGGIVLVVLFIAYNIYLLYSFDG